MTVGMRMSILFALLVCSAAVVAEPLAVPLTISPGGRHLVDQNGIPVFMECEAAWSLIANLETHEVETYLQDRAQRGFNCLLVSLIEAYFVSHVNEECTTAGAPWPCCESAGAGSCGAPNTIYGTPPFLVAGDFSTPNPEYFAHADWVLERARDLGFVVFLTPAYLGYECRPVGWCSQLMSTGIANARTYGEFVGRRYQSGYDHVIWVGGGDHDATDSGADSVMDAVMNGISSQDDKLISAHAGPLESGREAYGDRSWCCDIESVYGESGGTEPTCDAPASETFRSWARTPPVPVIWFEGRYENTPTGNPVGPECLRRQRWISALGGSVGHIFGNRPIWLFDEGWQDELGSTGTGDMERANSYLLSLDWASLVPDYEHQVVISGYGALTDGSYVGCAFNSQLALIYAPRRQRFTVDLGRLSGSNVTATWLNPATGSYSSAGEYPAEGTREFMPPANGDWLMILEGVSGGTRPDAPKDLAIQNR